MYNGGRSRLCWSASLRCITTEWAGPAKIQMSSFQFEIQLRVINTASGGTSHREKKTNVTDLKTIRTNTSAESRTKRESCCFCFFFHQRRFFSFRPRLAIMAIGVRLRGFSATFLCNRWLNLNNWSRIIYHNSEHRYCVDDNIITNLKIENTLLNILIWISVNTVVGIIIINLRNKT